MVQEACQKHQIPEQTFYCWRNKFGSMVVLEVRRLEEHDTMHNSSRLWRI